MYFITFDPFARDRQRQVRHSRALPLDVVRHENDVTLRLDVPGIDPESIDVTVDNGILSVSVKRQEERTSSDRFFVRERTMGTFTRRMRLPQNLNADAVEASYHNGVLEVRIPVLEQAKPRKIEISQADGHEELAA